MYSRPFSSGLQWDLKEETYSLLQALSLLLPEHFLLVWCLDKLLRLLYVDT
jgi:hypothetical protein